MNRQPFETPPQSWSSKLSPSWIRLLGPWRRRTLRRRQRFVNLEVQNAEVVRTALDQGTGVLLTPNHSFHYDSYVLTEAARELGRPVHFLTAWQVFAMSSRLERWTLQKHGCFSIDRESIDLQAFRQAVEILRTSPFPLVVFPEGEIYHTNDRVMPFREGAAAIALAAARKTDRKIICVPCAVKCWYLEDPTPRLLDLMRRLEERLVLRPRSDLPLPRRICLFAETVLTIKELDYLGKPQSGPLPARIANLEDTVLHGLEQRYPGSDPAEPVPERVQELRRLIIKQQAEGAHGEAERRQQAKDLDDLFFVQQLFSYPGDYVAERPTIERMAETLDKFEEDVLGVEYPEVRGPRRVAVRFGEPIEAPHEKTKSDGRHKGDPGPSARLTTQLQERVQTLLDELNAAHVDGRTDA